MTREMIILADLRLDTPLHIGTGRGADPTDSPLRRAGDGRILLPGRALGGALRTAATRLAPRLNYKSCKALLPLKEKIDGSEGTIEPCLCQVCQMFGELYPSEENDRREGGEASRLWVSDAYLQPGSPGDDPQTHLRDGVGLDRTTRIAARHVKFDQEILPAGSVFKIRLTYKEAEPGRRGAQEQLLAAALGEWQAGRGRLGGSAARGLGAFTLLNIECRRNSLDTRADLIAYLKSDARWELGKPDVGWLERQLQTARLKLVPAPTGDISAAGGFVEIGFNITLDETALFNDPMEAAFSGFDHASQMTVSVGRGGRPVLPGSSLRGALRSRAEKIARTLAILRLRERDAFLTGCPACNPLAGHSSLPLASCDSRLDIPPEDETSEDDLCLSCRLFGSVRRGSRLWVADAAWAGGDLEAKDWKAQDFLAIDRFTGGGQDGAKFDAVALIGARFRARLILHNPQDWELGWLALVLRDLREGQLTLGFGAAKGYGLARADKFVYTFGYLTPDDIPKAERHIQGGRESGVYRLFEPNPTVLAQIQEAWVEAFHDRLKHYKQSNHAAPLQQDSFFDEQGRLLALYGLPRTER